MKNILYVGPYKQSDEWGNISKGMIKALLEQKEVDLTIRPVWFSSEKNPKEIEFLKPYESKMMTGNKDVLIQHGLANFLNPDFSFTKNIAVTSIDSIVGNMDWPYHLNLFDLVLVFSNYEKEMLIKSGVEENKIAWAPFPPIFMLEESENFELDFNCMMFYTDALFNETSGLEDVIVSYLSEFSILDEVALILIAGENVEQSKKRIEELKRKLGIFNNTNRYPNIIIIDGRGRSCIDVLHKRCHSFIQCGYNARMSSNLVKAIYYNKIPIVLDTMADSRLSWPYLVDSYEDVCMHGNRPVAGLYSGEFTWRKPLKVSLKNKMRELYNKYRNEGLTEEEEKVAKLKSQLSYDWGFLCS